MNDVKFWVVIAKSKERFFASEENWIIVSDRKENEIRTFYENSGFSIKSIYTTTKTLVEVDRITSKSQVMFLFY